MKKKSSMVPKKEERIMNMTVFSFVFGYEPKSLYGSLMETQTWDFIDAIEGGYDNSNRKIGKITEINSVL